MHGTINTKGSYKFNVTLVTTSWYMKVNLYKIGGSLLCWLEVRMLKVSKCHYGHSFFFFFFVIVV